MHKIFSLIHAWLVSLFEETPAQDPLATMSPRELADLPVYHPRFDTCLGA